LFPGAIRAALNAGPSNSRRFIVIGLGTGYVVGMLWGLLILLAAGLAVVFILGVLTLGRVLVRPPRRTVGGAVARGLPTDPAEAGAEYERRTVRDADGRPIEVWLVEGEAPRGPVIVLLHGWADGRLGELLWLPALRPVASKLVLYDQRGHGESPHKRCTWGRFETEDALGVIEWLHREVAAGPVVLMGQSMGAGIAVRAAVRAGAERVGAVVTDSPFRRPREIVSRTVRRRGLPAWPLVPLAFSVIRPICRGALRADLTEDATALPQPLLVMHGAEDPVVPPAEARAIAEVAPNGRLELFEEAGHLQPACSDPEGYTGALNRFLAGALGGGSVPATGPHGGRMARKTDV
jgi:pimeloyl-ACP methyl ester carboxylesterase